MNGLLPANFSSPVPPAWPGPAWPRLCAALAVSFLLHVALLFMPHLGARSGGAPQAPRARIDVVLKPLAPAAAGDKAGASAPPAPRGARDTEPQPPGPPRPRAPELLPLPAPTYYTVDQLTKPPQPLSQPDLTPPQIARSISGNVVLKLWISELGEVVSAEVEKSDLPPKISRTAAQAFAKVRFAPGEIDGRRVGSVMRLEVTYGRGRRSP